MSASRAFSGWLFRLTASLALVVLLVGRAAASDAGFVYALDQVNGGSNQIYGFSVDPVTGVLTPLPGFPVASGGIGGSGSFSEHMTSVSGRLYVINDGDSTVSAFTVDQITGALTAMPFSPFAVGGSLACVTAHAGGSPVIVGTNAGLRSFLVSPTAVTAAAGNPYSTSGTPPFSCGISRDGNFVYTGGNSGSAISGFSLNSSTGELTPLAGTPFDTTAGNPVAYATDGSGRLFVSNFGAGVRAFTTSSGIPTGVAGNPFASGLTGGVQGLLHPSGFYMVADRSANKVGVFQIGGSGAATTLAAVAGSPFTTGGSYTGTLALTSDGGLLIAANGISRNLTVFRVNPGTGFLTSLVLQPANSLGAAGLITGVAFVPFVDVPVSFVYALDQVNGSANQIYGFSLDSTTGALFELPGFPVASGGNGSAGTVSEQLAYGKGRLYVLNDGSDTMSIFAVNQSTGALTALPFSPVALGAGTWDCVAVHPSGSVVVAGNSDGSGTLASFVITASSATAASGNPFGTGGPKPFSCAFSRDGKYVYTGSTSTTTIAGFSVNAVTGVLTGIGGSPFDSGAPMPVAYATDRAGRLFVANLGIGQVRAFTTSGGVPTGAAANPFVSGLTTAVHGVLHPSGFYMVADTTGNQIGVFQIGGTGAATTLTAVGPPFPSSGLFTDALALSPNGGLLIAANGNSRNLSEFTVNAMTGTLNPVGVQPVNTLGATGLVTGLVIVRGRTSSNTGVITIFDAMAAVPYPSNIAVPAGLGPVTKVAVTLRGFSHTFPADVDVLLVGPGGQKVLLMSDVGGGGDTINLTLTYDDSGPAPSNSQLASGTFRPTNMNTGDTFPAPAPAGPYDSPALSVFNGTDPTGTWSLYVVDDAVDDVGSVSDGWSLVINDFTDDPLTSDVSTIKAVHITELRARIDAIRSALGMGAFSWGPAVTAGSTAILPSQIADLREALRQAYVQAGAHLPTYTDPVLSAGTLIKAVHLLQIRQAIQWME